MDFTEFQDLAVETLRNQNPELIFDLTEVNPWQGHSYHGLSVQVPGSDLKAAVNLDPFYQESLRSGNTEELLEQLQQEVVRAVEHMPAIDSRSLLDYEAMKPTLSLQLISVPGNERRLMELPHQTIGDIAAVCRFEISQSRGGAVDILVTDSMLAAYGIPQEQLYEDAQKQSPQRHPPTLRPVSEVLSELSGGLVEPGSLDTSLYVASVEGGANGAAVLCYPGFLEEAAARLGGDFFILPSSVHEVLFLPEDGQFSREELEQMITEINQTEVEPRDRLSNQVYHYDSLDRILETARDFEDRTVFRQKEAEVSVEDGTISVLLIQPGTYPRQIQIENTLGKLQDLVGGDIEVCCPFEDGTGLICNEEGKLQGLSLNRALRDPTGRICDIVAGDFLTVGLTEDGFCSLTPDQVQKYEKLFHQPEAFVKMSQNILAVPIPDEDVLSRSHQEQEHSRNSRQVSDSRDCL